MSDVQGLSSRMSVGVPCCRFVEGSGYRAKDLAGPVKNLESRFL